MELYTKVDESIVDDEETKTEIKIHDAPRPSLVMSGVKTRASMIETSAEKSTNPFVDQTVET